MSFQVNKTKTKNDVSEGPINIHKIRKISVNTNSKNVKKKKKVFLKKINVKMIKNLRFK